MEQYKTYAIGLGANLTIVRWLEKTLGKYLVIEKPSTEEVEHIIDYLMSDVAPVRISQMTYDEAKRGAEKWNATLIKKGEHIKETATDTEVVLDFKDGFKVVKLVGKNAFEREGYLMRHCVASYFGKETEVYSLRDIHNMPHCTIEKNQQIKGKGNGKIGCLL